jgi:hypothetical protein
MVLTHPQRVFAALVIQHATHMHHIDICGQSGAIIFFHTVLWTARFSKKKKVIEHMTCVLIFSTTSAWKFSHFKSNRARYICAYVSKSSRCFSRQILIKLELSRHIFDKYSNTKFYQNPSCGSRLVPCGWTDGHVEVNSSFSPFCEGAYKENEPWFRSSIMRRYAAPYVSPDVSEVMSHSFDDAASHNNTAMNTS